jgi:formate hydrogenlyase subunit 3/multisubunit Na+/H+ antiporter MnhD subunit
MSLNVGPFETIAMVVAICLVLYSGHYINTHGRRQNFIAWLILTGVTLIFVLALKLFS